MRTGCNSEKAMAVSMEGVGLFFSLLFCRMGCSFSSVSLWGGEDKHVPLCWLCHRLVSGILFCPKPVRSCLVYIPFCAKGPHLIVPLFAKPQPSVSRRGLSTTGFTRCGKRSSPRFSRRQPCPLFTTITRNRKSFTRVPPAL